MIKLLVVQNGTVLLDVVAELVGQALACRFAFQGPKSRRERLKKRQSQGITKT